MDMIALRSVPSGTAGGSAVRRHQQAEGMPPATWPQPAHERALPTPKDRPVELAAGQEVLPEDAEADCSNKPWIGMSTKSLPLMCAH